MDPEEAKVEVKVDQAIQLFQVCMEHQAHHLDQADQSDQADQVDQAAQVSQAADQVSQVEDPEDHSHPHPDNQRNVGSRPQHGHLEPQTPLVLKLTCGSLPHGRNLQAWPGLRGGSQSR